MIEQEDLRVRSLGGCRLPSPLKFDSPSHPAASHFLTDSDRIRLNVKFCDDEDTSYHFRSMPANVYDRYLCDQMGRHAVHAAMAGKTGLIIGFENSHYIHVPIPVVVSQTKRMEVSGDLWPAVFESTSQPRW